MGQLIVVADRNRHVRELIKRELEAEGHEVLSAKSGQDVLSLCRPPSPCRLVILDADLPDLAPGPVLRELRRSGCAARVLIHGFQAEDQNGLSELGASYLRKSEDVDRLKAEVRLALAGAGGERTPPS